MREIVAEARTWIGTPVVWEASLKGVGCDCRGLVAGVARELGRPEAAELEARVVGYAGRIEETALLAGLDRLFLRQAQDERGGWSLAPGDVLAFRYPNKRRQMTVQHLAIATTEGRMVHAYMGDPARVCEVPIGAFWSRRLAGVWRWRAEKAGGE